MADKPILFSGPMVRALLDGRKTQTRRILKPQPFASGYFDGEIEARFRFENDGRLSARFNANAVGGGGFLEEWCTTPIGKGDRLWVREAWRPDPDGLCEQGLQWIFYPASGIQGSFKPPAEWKMPKAAQNGRVPGIHMPRWASRLTLTVTDVRVQRLQEISEGDAVAEGVSEIARPDKDGGRHFGVKDMHLSGRQIMRASDAFAALWTQINGAGSWDANPWIAAYTFKVEKKNIDTPPTQQEKP